jgi:methylmalonyl-CoA/ethylmalonyl-CoA epimerase
VPADPRPSYARMVEAAGRSGLLAGLVLGIDHVAVCVGDLDAAGGAWAALVGAPLVDREEVAIQRVTAAFVRPGGTAAVELVCPSQGNAGLDKFLGQRGDALHHIAFAVSDLREALARLGKAGVELIDQAPRPGAGGHLVAFLHPRAMGGTLVELVERREEHHR